MRSKQQQFNKELFPYSFPLFSFGRYMDVENSISKYYYALLLYHCGCFSSGLHMYIRNNINKYYCDFLLYLPLVAYSTISLTYLHVASSISAYILHHKVACISFSFAQKLILTPMISLQC